MDRTVTIEGKRVELTHLERVMYPEAGFTKAHVIDYYRRAARWVLPHLKDRPISLKRYPEGVDKPFFFEKKCPSYRPEWMARTEPFGTHGVRYCLINDLASLVWIENLGSIEVHTMLSRAPHLERPTMVVFDLDPGAPAGLGDCLEIALILRDMLQGVGLQCFPKTSGGKGLHFYIPLNTEATYEQTKAFARTTAQIMEKHYPDRVVSRMTKSLRQGKVLIDWSQNSEHKTTVCVYSLRGRAQPTVSTPVTWEEVEAAVKAKDPRRLVFTAGEALERLKRMGDLFEPVLTLRQTLPAGGKRKGAARAAKAAAPKQTPGGALREYRRKRDFVKTPEPSGKAEASGGQLFVIQKHDATRLHYDLRLESEGVLKSWAVPKGFSSDPMDKRLAVQTEDHPIEYANFEGIIPKHEYGGGTMIVWDRGTFENMTHDLRGRPIPVEQALKNGKLEIFFRGRKVQGGYALVRMKSGRRIEEKNNWLLIKLKDPYVGSLPDDPEMVGESVLSGRTIRDLKKKK